MDKHDLKIRLAHEGEAPELAELVGKTVKKAWMLSHRRFRVVFETDEMIEVSPLVEHDGRLLFDVKVGTVHPDADLGDWDAFPRALNPLTVGLVGQHFCGTDTQHGMYLLKFDEIYVVVDPRCCFGMPPTAPMPLIKAALEISALEMTLESDAQEHPSTPPGSTPPGPESPAPPRCTPPRKAGPPRPARSRRRRDWIQ
jgi:hypothetical protein